MAKNLWSMISSDEEPVRFLAKMITGYLGTALLIIVFIPQVIRVYRLKETHALSPVFLILNWFGALNWLAYGALAEEWPVLLANIAIFICINLLILAKILYRGEQPKLVEINV